MKDEITPIIDLFNPKSRLNFPEFANGFYSFCVSLMLVKGFYLNTVFIEHIETKQIVCCENKVYSSEEKRELQKNINAFTKLAIDKNWHVLKYEKNIKISISQFHQQRNEWKDNIS
jgi:hypothetical protein